MIEGRTAPSPHPPARDGGFQLLRLRGREGSDRVERGARGPRHDPAKIPRDPAKIPRPEPSASVRRRLKDTRDCASDQPFWSPADTCGRQRRRAENGT
jgi:hypothetical protein